MSESYEWVLRCISGSTNAFHIDCCQTIIDLFWKQYGPPDDSVQSLADALRSKAIELMVEV